MASTHRRCDDTRNPVLCWLDNTGIRQVHAGRERAAAAQLIPDGDESLRGRVLAMSPQAADDALEEFGREARRLVVAVPFETGCARATLARVSQS